MLTKLLSSFGWESEELDEDPDRILPSKVINCITVISAQTSLMRGASGSTLSGVISLRRMLRYMRVAGGSDSVGSIGLGIAIWGMKACSDEKASSASRNTALTSA
jgi:hypothetical protein